MRKIKYRAWNRKTQRFVVLVIHEDGIRVIDSPDSQVDDLEEWQQFTGLKDKDGRDIWEGDVVEYAYESIRIGRVSNISAVIWRGQRWEFEPIMQKNKNGRMTGKWLRQMEVVSHIFEVPELLN